MPKVVIIEEIASCGGPVTQAIVPPLPSVYINNKPVAREGLDTVHGAVINGVLGTTAKVFVQGYGIALENDTVAPHTVGDTTHTATLVSTQQTVFAGTPL